MPLRRFFSFLRLSIQVRLYNLKDFFRTAFRYYKDLQFAKIDLSLLLSYFTNSPYRISRKKWHKLYGETPFITLQKIAEAAAVTSEDVFYELGSGRGRGCFWIAHFVGCSVVGVEINSHFVTKAMMVKQKFHCERVVFLCADILETPLETASVIYLYGTTFSDRMIAALAEKLRRLKKGTKIISISYALQDFCGAENAFRLVKEFDVEFVWGTTTAYLQEVV